MEGEWEGKGVGGREGEEKFEDGGAECENMEDGIADYTS